MCLNSVEVGQDGVGVRDQNIGVFEVAMRDAIGAEFIDNVLDLIDGIETVLLGVFFRAQNIRELSSRNKFAYKIGGPYDGAFAAFDIGERPGGGDLKHEQSICIEPTAPGT